MQDRIEVIEKLRQKLLQGGCPEAWERQHQAGKLTARERVEKLLDPGTFSEIALFMSPASTGLDIDKETMRGDGLVAGYGKVNDRTICVWAQDATVLGGSVGNTHGQKMVDLMERALKARVPCVGLIDSEGIRVEDVITTPTNYSYDRMMYLQTVASGVIPQLSLIMGPCLGAAALSAQLADFVFMVCDTSYTCVAPPPEANAREIGEARIHAQSSGCCDVLAQGDEDCLRKARELLSLLPANNSQGAPVVDTGDDPERTVDELTEIVPVDSSRPFDMHKVISVVVDNGQFFEVRRDWAANLIIGFARMGNKTVGVLANNPMVKAGCMDIDSADKMSRFVRFCDAFNIPRVYLADTPAFLPAVAEERGGIIRHGAKVVFSNSVASSPTLTVYIRKCYGGGNLAMAGGFLSGDIGLSWPIAEILLMHPEGAAAILYRKEIAAAENPKEEAKRRTEQFRRGTVENVWEAISLQDYIHPKDTRTKIIKSLAILKEKQDLRPWKRHDNMPL